MAGLSIRLDLSDLSAVLAEINAVQSRALRPDHRRRLQALLDRPERLFEVRFLDTDKGSVLKVYASTALIDLAREIGDGEPVRG